MTRAQGKTRRWPDLLIGLLVLLLLGGFASLLLGQRSQPTSGVTSAATDPVTEATSEPITIPSAPGTDAAAGTGEETTSAPELTAPEEAQTQAEGTDPAVTATTSPDAAGTSSAATGELAQAPAQPAETAPTATDTTAPTETTEPTTAAPSTPAVAPRAGGAVTPSEARTPLRSDYRISLGSFATRRTAERLTQGVRDLGYTVYPIDVGEGVVAQVGPFADEATARQALADIQRAYPGAVVYPPRGRNLRQGGVSEAPAPTPAAPTPNPSTSSSSAPATPAVTTTPATPAAATAPETGPEAVPSPAPATSTPPNAPAAATPTPGPTATAPGSQATSGGPVYLQVGAFDRVESAQRLVTELRTQGYVPTVNAPEGGKVTVLVGPFSGSALDGAEERLSASGLDHFRVR